MDENIKEIRKLLNDYMKKQISLDDFCLKYLDIMTCITLSVVCLDNHMSDEDIINFKCYTDTAFQIMNKKLTPEAVKFRLLNWDKVTLVDEFLVNTIHNDSCFEEKKISVGKRKVYLDMNLLSELMKLDNTKFKDDIQIVYSPEHIEEIADSDESFHESSLKRLSEITNNIEVRYYDEGGYTFGIESPFYVYEKRVIPEKNLIHSAKDMKVIDYQLDLNLSEYTDRKKYNSEVKEDNPLLFCKKYVDDINKVLKLINSSFVVDMESTSNNTYNEYDECNSIIHDLYHAMDIMGFKQDKISENKLNNFQCEYDDKIYKTIRSSRCDIEHLLYGSCCDYFITKDKNLYYRAANIFYLLNRKCKVLLLRNVSEDSLLNSIEKIIYCN